jgi:transcriptional regulator with XRE-family HTH domain
MGRPSKITGTVGERSLGMEIRAKRVARGLSLDKVGDVLGWSANTMSRFERGQRPDTRPEEVSAMLAAIGVTGADRDKLMRMAGGHTGQGWWEPNFTRLTDQPRTYLRLESKATRLASVQPLLVHGLLQTPDYCRALMVATGQPEEEMEGRIARRLARQALLTRSEPPALIFIMTELMLRQPVGGNTVMARQVRHIAEAAERTNVNVRIVPATVAAHPGLDGAFTVMEFADEPSVVHLEGRQSALFPENPDEVEAYILALAKLTELALDEPTSRELLHAVAEDLERARQKS